MTLTKSIHHAITRIHIARGRGALFNVDCKTRIVTLLVGNRFVRRRFSLKDGRVYAFGTCSSIRTERQKDGPLKRRKS